MIQTVLANRTKYLKILLFILTAVTVAALLYQHRQQFKFQFHSIDTFALVKLILTQLLLVLAMGLPFKILCRIYKAELKFKDWAGLSFICSMLNQLLPYRPGLGFRIYYLYKHFNLKLSKILHINAIYLALSLLVSTTMLLIALNFVDFKFSFSSVGLTALVALSLALLIGIAISFKYQNQAPKSNALKLLIKLISASPILLVKSLAAMLLVRTIAVAAHFYAFSALNFAPSISLMILIVALLSLAATVLITPGNIGINESVCGFITQQLYGDFSLGFTAIALYRACNIISTSFGGVIFSYLLLGRVIPQKYSGFKTT